MRSGGLPAGSGRALRLDPFALPVQYAASDAAADERVRHVELHRERVVVRRSLHGMRMALNMPVNAFLGVGVRVLPPEGEAQAAVAVVLEHKDPSLALPLFVANESNDVLEQWEKWSSVLGLPRIVEDPEGGWRQPFAEDIGEPQPQSECVIIEFPEPRRRRHTAMKGRRPSILARRKPGLCDDMPVYRDEREIIAPE